jgi:RimJ/RimL family protein N-acetyltransferase
VISLADWPSAPALSSERLSLEPMRVDHAQEMAPLLEDPRLHAFTGGRPLTAEELRNRYQRQVRGRSDDGSQRWFNWVARLRESGQAVGTVQATVTAQGDKYLAELAWVIASSHQRVGYAREAAMAMAAWLRRQGANRLVADIHPRHGASMKVARALGLTPTSEVIDGEIRWASDDLDHAGNDGPTEAAH